VNSATPRGSSSPPVAHPAPESPLAAVLVIVVELVLLAVAQFGGGTPWTVLVALSLVAESAGGLSVRGLARIGCGLVWIAAFRMTGNRELFFPFAMYLAAHVGLGVAKRGPWLGVLGTGLVVAAFLAFRIAQGATRGVLAVEAAVAVAIIASLFTVRPLLPEARSTPRDVALTVGASLAAYAGLTL
jgi:hypothetical protein